MQQSEPFSCLGVLAVRSVSQEHTGRQLTLGNEECQSAQAQFLRGAKGSLFLSRPAFFLEGVHAHVGDILLGKLCDGVVFEAALLALPEHLHKGHTALQLRRL